MGYTVIDGVSYESEMVEKLEQAFAESDKTDAILVVSGKKLQVNKANLLEHALGLYNSKEAFADLSSSGNRNFSDNLKLRIFNKLFENYDTFFK
ncbi:hypothetical protein CAEBREN_25929 [Caenorhabditis brenneri]|uniref:BTB domain-containing protein n=1 Tax=Caenorhabditis brenneri TaxID=135651 RepID=G0MVY9_CAEBE|nr:hypothetical protein CAEBREN_25929 [Caenorhabditis brenneri]